MTHDSSGTDRQFTLSRPIGAALPAQPCRDDSARDYDAHPLPASPRANSGRNAKGGDAR